MCCPKFQMWTLRRGQVGGGVERRELGVSREVLSLLQDQAGEHLRGRLDCPHRNVGGLPHVCLPRLWKVWVQVPSPKPFFQPLYDGHSGDFKVSAFPTL